MAAQAKQETNVVAIAKLQPSRMPIAGSIATEFSVTAADWRVLVDQIFPMAKTVEAVGMALAYCRRRNLDIFKRPVHIVPMWSSALGRMVETVWPGIAEIRTTAARTGQYAGIDEVVYGPLVTKEFTGEKEIWSNGRSTGSFETVTETVSFPEWASVVVYRVLGGQRFGYHAKVYWEEAYASNGKTGLPNTMWAKRPRGQLDKCVEAAALRKAFPEEIGNDLTAEEMEGRTIDTAANDAAPVSPIAQITPPSPPSPPSPPKASEPDDEAGGEQQTPEEFLTELEANLATGDSEEVVMEIWDQFDVESTLTGNDAVLQKAFDMRKARIDHLTIPFPDKLPPETAEAVRNLRG